jgi:hypothetical protein
MSLKFDSGESTLRIKFASCYDAVLVQQCLAVDDELQPSKVHKEITTENNYLVMYVNLAN